MLSVPAGNVWVEETASTPGKKVVVNALPRPVEVNLRFTLPVRAEGYRFAGGTVVDVGDGGTYLVRATAAPSGARTVVEAMPATGNAPPRILVEPLALGDEATVRLTAARTIDPDAATGDGVLALVWTLPDGSSVRASEVAFARPAADTQVTVEAIDRR